MSLSGFAAGFASGWGMVDGLLKDIEKRKEKNKDKDGLAVSVEQAGQELAGNLDREANRPGDGTTPETALPQDFGAPEEMPPYASTEGMPNTLGGPATQIAGRDRDLLIRTVVGEAANEPVEGQAGVAHVVLNRLRDGNYGQGMPDVLFAPRQFEPWNTRRDELMALREDSPAYRRAAEVVDNVLSGKMPDPTNGARNFANVSTVRQRAARGETSASTNSWVEDVAQNGIRIGNHTFGTPGSRPGAQTQPAVPGPRAAIDVPEDEFHGMQYGMQPTYFANAGGAIPDDQGRTTFSSQAPNAQGSVFLQHETQRPQQQARRIQTQPAQAQPQQPQQAIPTGPSTADRFRDMRANHTQRRADAEAARAAAAAQQPTQTSGYRDWENSQAAFADHSYWHGLKNDPAPTQFSYNNRQGNPESTPEYTAYLNQRDRLDTIHQTKGGLRTDPSGRYLVTPPGVNSVGVGSAQEWAEYQKLPAAPPEMIEPYLR